jgi:putative endonuclease
LDPIQGIAFEKRVKGWKRAKKEALIKGDFKRLVELSNHNKHMEHGSASSP